MAPIFLMKPSALSQAIRSITSRSASPRLSPSARYGRSTSGMPACTASNSLRSVASISLTTTPHFLCRAHTRSDRNPVLAVLRDQELAVARQSRGVVRLLFEHGLVMRFGFLGMVGLRQRLGQRDVDADRVGIVLERLLELGDGFFGTPLPQTHQSERLVRVLTLGVHLLRPADRPFRQIEPALLGQLHG